MYEIKFVLMMKRIFSEFYEIKRYRKQPSEQFVVKKYSINHRKITINEEK